MIRIGIICPSEIALRRFMPALSKIGDISFFGIASANMEEWEGANERIIQQEKEKAKSFVDQYGGKIFDSYSEMINSNEVDAVYLPLPPALHFRWAKRALTAGKHVFLEKPATIKLEDTQELISLAEKNNLALHENYMFIFHDQLKVIKNIVESGEIGDARLYRISFGFPRRSPNDFRYNKALGGGALLDCGGYTIKYASILLGKSAKLKYAQKNFIPEFDVDIYGSAALVNDEGATAQVSFGMDNSYKCDLEVWGSKGCLTTGRVLTAPESFVPKATIKGKESDREIDLPADDAFKKSIEHFYKCVSDQEAKNRNYKEILRQAELIQEFLIKSNK